MQWAETLHPFLSRAGGAGGGHSSGGGYHGGGGGGGGGDITFLVFYLLGRPWGWVILLIVAYVIWKSIKSSQFQGSFSDGDAQTLRVQQENVGALSPEQVQSLKGKVAVAFMTIQEAWSKKDPKKMRRFISDGVYQRFHAQFTMMNMLDQTNIIDNITIRDLQILNYGTDGDFETAEIAVTADVDDQFVSQKFPQFNSPGGREEFTEVWSFLRRKDSDKKANIYTHDQCPKCSGPLTDKLMDTARCPYCGVYINSGEFDWVLAEITQAQDYSAAAHSRMASPQLPTQIQGLRAHEPHFSPLVLEDRASNAFLQIMIGVATKDTRSLQRFSTAEFAAKAQQMSTGQNYIYDRLYLQSVSLLDLGLKEDLVTAKLLVVCAYQRVRPAGDQLFELDDAIFDHYFVLTLQHQLSQMPQKGSIYANACPKCGAAQKDSLSPVCEYCNSVLNDPKGDWIVADLSTVQA